MLLTGFCAAALLSVAGCATTPAEGQSYGLEQDSVVGDYLKARFAAGNQQLDVAADAYARAAKAAPEDALLLRHAFFYELAAGNVEAAADLGRQLMKPEYRTFEEGDEPGEALRQAIAAARAQQSLSLPMLTVAAAQMSDGQYRQALNTLESEKDSAYAESISYLMAAWATYETDGVAAGLAWLSQTTDDTFTGFTPLHKALMLEAAGRIRPAREAYEVAMVQYPAEQTQIAFASFLERHGEKQEAEELYRAMVEDGAALAGAGRVGLIRLGKPIAGETDAMIRAAKRTRAPKLVENGADGAGLALYHFAWGAYRQALQEQAAALRAGFNTMEAVLNMPLAFAQLSSHLNPDFEAPYYLIGSIYQNYEMQQDAINAYAKVSYGDSFYEYAISDMATAYVALERSEKAVDVLSDYVERDIFAVSTALRLAGLYSGEERYDAAEATLTRAIKKIEGSDALDESTNLWRYYFSRGVLYTDLGQWSRAEADLIRAKDLSNDEPYVLNYLGYSWVERGENLEEAFDMIEQALQREPNSGAITDSLGWAYYQLGDYDKAIDYLERAVELEPADAVITDHLGDAYWQTGRKAEARYEWRRALTYDPDEELEEKIEQKLANRQLITADNDASGD